jgi:hypothetical protein
MLHFTLMLFTEVVVKSLQLQDVSFTLLNSQLSQDSKSQSSWLKFNAQMMLLVVSMVALLNAEVLLSVKNQLLEHPLL